MSAISSWFKAHSSAILATIIAVSKAGLFGKLAVTLGSAVGAVLGVQ